MYLRINGLQLNDYIINQDFFNNEIAGIYGRDKKTIKQFLNVISGINKNKKTCFYNDEDIFDNEEYFNNRLYFDFTKKYLSTLRVNYIDERLKQKYNLAFNKETFINTSKDLDVRGETEITYTYKFTPTGNTFVNYSLTKSLDKNNLIINNPTINLRMEDDLDYITTGLTNKNDYNSVILGLDNLKAFSKKLDKIIFFTDFKTIITATNNDTAIVFNQSSFFLISNEDKIFGGEKIVCLNKYTKEELKSFTKSKIDYKVISIYDVEQYMGEV